ncbi:MAG TPA: hypothetical protein VD902_18060 [Symbiobacteriaceae bacterium]|nr:hypothetical protein [Symbiobacteriaceae bacterium]
MPLRVRPQITRPGRRTGIVALMVSAAAAVLSLGSVVSTYAMPVEARTTEAWYSYQSTVGWDFTAQVKPSKFYPGTVVQAAQLYRGRGPVEPPVYHRVLITRVTEGIEVKVPYHYKADRPAPLNVSWRIDGTITIPGFWQAPYPLAEEKHFTTTGAEVSGEATLVIPVNQLLAEMEQNRLMNVLAEPVELRIKPALHVEAEGLLRPVSVDTAGDFTVLIRSSTIEVSDARTVQTTKDLTETRVVPITVNVLGTEIPVGALRQVSLTVLVSSVVTGALLLWVKRKRPDDRALLQKLGPKLIEARGYELPGDVAVVEVRSARELLQLQAQSERHVIVVNNNYYLQDGATCYRFTAAGSSAAGTKE